MKLKLDLKLKKLFIKLAEVRGELEIKPIGEAATGGFVADRVIKALKDAGLTGVVTIDGDRVVEL